MIHEINILLTIAHNVVNVHVHQNNARIVIFIENERESESEVGLKTSREISWEFGKETSILINFNIN